MANGEVRNWYGSSWIRKDKRLAIYLRDGFSCVYCAKDLKDVKAKYRTLDHVTPVARGGSNSERNLVTCCKLCNDTKNSTTVGQLCIARRLDFATVDARVRSQTRRKLNRALAKQMLAGQFDADTAGGLDS